MPGGQSSFSLSYVYVYQLVLGRQKYFMNLFVFHRVLKDLNNYRGGRASRLIDILFGEADLGPPFNTARDGKDAFDEGQLRIYRLSTFF